MAVVMSGSESRFADFRDKIDRLGNDGGDSISFDVGRRVMCPVRLNSDRRVQPARQVGGRFDNQVLGVGCDRAGEQRIGFFMAGDNAVWVIAGRSS